VGLVALGVLLALYVFQLLFDPLEDLLATQVEGLLTNISMLGAGALCAFRAWARKEERLAWSLLSVGVLSWGVGDLYYTLAFWGDEDAPFPSLADVGYIGFYPAVYAGLVFLLRERLPKVSPLLWVDGLIGGLAAAAVGAAVLFTAVLASTEGPPATVATNLAYPLGDLVILSLVVGTLVATGRAAASAWAWIAVGLLVFSVSDALFLMATAEGGYVHGALFDAGWNAGGTAIAVAAWWPVWRVTVSPVEGWRTIVLPICFALVALDVLVVDHFARTNALALGLAVASLLAVLARLVMTFGDNIRMLRASRHEALTDSLTGLHNRRRLTLDLAGVFEDAEAGRATLALFDLDGFKQYNDNFRHAAGDALLARLGHKLAAAVGERGTAYRMGGDEFCVLTKVGDGDSAGIVDDAAGALSESGESFTLGCSRGTALLGLEAHSPEEALRVADQRMYRDKHARRGTPSRQTTDALLRALIERHPALDVHVQGVGDLVEATGRRLDVEEEELERIRLAGQLHDIGKMAIPDEILDKPGPLAESEWSFVKRHPLIGERIVSAAPALTAVARLVRSSHERLDGGGYPDGLSGEEIPFGARIISACDAFDAMVSSRPYRPAMSVPEALEELRRCAGSQFDPQVVEAVHDVVGERVRVVGEADYPRSADARNGGTPVAREPNVA
jgi:two-component system, cell cycle response regulator